MTDHRAALSLAPDEQDQVPRLKQFRADHPSVIIGRARFGTWQARIPEASGETVTTRRTLRELLDKLDDLTSDEPGTSAGRPVS